MIEFIFMLTHNDQTVPDALDVYGTLRDTDLRYVGFKDIGATLDELRVLTRAIQADGRVYLASALIDGEVWLRPCFVNFRTTEDDVLDVVEIAAEIGERLAV